MFGKASGFAANLDLSRARRHRRLQAQRRGGERRSAAARCPRRATSTATASTTSSSAPTAPTRTAPMPARATWCSARPSGFAADARPLARSTARNGFQTQRRGGGRPERLLGRVGRRRQRRRLRRPDRRRAVRRPERQRLPARAMWCSARPAGFAADLDLVGARRHATASSINGEAADDLSGWLGRLGRRRQRRRLRRPDRRRVTVPTRTAAQCRRQLRGVRQGLGLRRRASTCPALDGTQRLPAQRRGGGRLQRPLGRLGRRRQRRRLRRPDRRRPLRPTRARRRQLRGVRQICRTRRSTAPAPMHRRPSRGGDFNDTLSGLGGDDMLHGNGGNDSSTAATATTP